MSQTPNASLNVGFTVNSTDISQQASVLASDIATTSVLNGDSNEISRVAAVRELAQKYMDLIGNDLALWRLLRQDLDPQRRAYYLLGVASLIEANSISDSDPKRSVALLSEAATNLELAGIDPMSITAGTKVKLDNISKFAKCWFCGREMQGQGFHFVTLEATVSQYARLRYGSTTPHSLEDRGVVACKSCATAIKNVAENVAKGYYEMAMTQMRAMEQRLNARIAALEHQLGSLRSRVNSAR